MASPIDALTILSLSPAPPGWRVVSLLPDRPWVDERAVACWALVARSDTGQRTVEPVVQTPDGRGLECPSGDWRLAAPNEPVARYLEDARRLATEEERRASSSALPQPHQEPSQEPPSRSLEAAPPPAVPPSAVPPSAVPPSAAPPPVPPPRPRSEHGPLSALRQRVAFSWMFDDTKPEGMDVLCDFLEYGCRLSPSESTDLSTLYDAYQLWCDFHGVPPIRSSRLAEVLAELGLRSEDQPDRRQVWSGLGVALTHPTIPEADSSPAGRAYEAAAIDTFIRSQLRSAPWSNTSDDAVYACYRAWCRRRELHPAPRERLAEQLVLLPWLRSITDASGDRTWKGVHCKCDLD